MDGHPFDFTMSIYRLLSRDDYYKKMMHRVPKTDVVAREEFILARVLDKTVLDIGATGPMHGAIKELAKICYGIDIVFSDEKNYFHIDLDHADHLPALDNLDIIIAGEVIEHLSNPGHFLDLLKTYDCPIVLTTPNAFSAAGGHYIRQGIEHVNPEHTCYFSYHTLTVLFERHGYDLTEWHWYNGAPFTAEGLICLISKRTS